MNADLADVHPAVASPEGGEDRVYWHCHVDGSHVGRPFRGFLEAIGFRPDQFILGTGEHAPVEHMTWKGVRQQAGDLKEKMSQIRAFLRGRNFRNSPTAPSHVFRGGDRNLFLGYVEAEAVQSDRNIPDRGFDPGVMIPFKLEMGRLESGFRASEIHVALDRRSDERLIRSIEAMGFWPVEMPKPDEGRVQVVFTAQARTRQQIDLLFPILVDYLERAGGGLKVSVKEEITVDYILSDPGAKIPPVIDRIAFLNPVIGPDVR